jgi:hypothetical protein
MTSPISEPRISRNDKCPCGSGRKYKHCCIGKGIDWSAKKTIQRLLPARPRVSFGQFGVVDAKIKAIVQGELKSRVESLSDTTPAKDRLEIYQAVREARILPDEAAEFLIGWAVQWMPFATDVEEEASDLAMEEEILAQYRRFGASDLADLFVSNRLELDRRHERGRQFFYGPPDAALANTLRAKGVID